MANVRLSWPSNPTSELVTGYEVQAQRDNGFWNVVATVSVPELIFVPSTPGVWRWKVRAVNLAGYSGFSNEAAGPEAPSTPGDITVEVVE